MPLPPNPPPISMGMILTLDTGKPSIVDVWSRRAKCPWLLAQTVTVSSEFHWAVAEWGSTYGISRLHL